MSAHNSNPLSMGQIEADLFMAKSAMDQATAMTSKRGKFFRGQAGYHLQQAAEKMIKIQIYDSGLLINNARMYRHSLDDLIIYSISLGLTLDIPKWVQQKKFVISGWEAEGRYDLHFVVRLDTLQKCYQELQEWYNRLKGTIK